MTVVYAPRCRDCDLGPTEFREALQAIFDFVGEPKRVLALPPDHTRSDSRAGELTTFSLAHARRAVGRCHAGSGHPCRQDAWRNMDYMFPGLPHDLVRVHRWRDDVRTLGEVDASSSARPPVAGSVVLESPSQQMLIEGGHDLILSLGKSCLTKLSDGQLQQECLRRYRWQRWYQ